MVTGRRCTTPLFQVATGQVGVGETAPVQGERARRSESQNTDRKWNSGEKIVPLLTKKNTVTIVIAIIILIAGLLK